MTPIPIQIRRWLVQPEVWRFVGFASTAVGLLCYALSSSFTHLFGEWNLMKIFLYSAFSIIICLTILFAKVWQHSAGVLFKAHLAVLVLIATSVYSFFLDKAVSGKPDAYSLISSAAFALMSLSLSWQPHCGFEVDLLYFFLGCLMLQLMKIKLLLGMVGAGFSYSLIILHSSLDNNLPKIGFLGHQDQHHVVIQVDSQHQQANTDSAIPVMPHQANTDGAPIMPFESRSKLMDCIQALKQNNSKLVDLLLEHVKEYLFAIVSEDIKDRRLETDHNFVMDALPSGIINDLHEIVKLMVAAGFEKECSYLYSSCRREFLQQCLSRLGLEEVDNYEDLGAIGRLAFEEKVGRWIKASNVAVSILFPSERRLCDRVFHGFSSAANLCFMDVCRGSTNQLLNLPDALAIGSRSPERLFRILYLRVLETMRDRIVEFESLFSDEYSLSLRNEAISVRNRVRVATRHIELENRIGPDLERHQRSSRKKMPKKSRKF